MKFDLFNILVIILFVLILSCATMFSCSTFIPHSTDSIFEKHSKFEGFQNNNNKLDYASNDKQNDAMDLNKENVIESSGESTCKQVFGFDGLYCEPKENPHMVDKIGTAKGSAKCVGKSYGLTDSMGGLCLNENQAKLLTTRGGNASTGDIEI